MKRLERYAHHLESFGPLARVTYRASIKYREWIRTRFAARYLTGDGIEIGAQHCPTRVAPDRARVRYVDRISGETNAMMHGLDSETVVTPDLSLEADALVSIADASVDFVIGNHILEHTEDPLLTLQEWLRVLRPGGILFLSVPNFRANEYDFMRRPEPLSHFTRLFGKRDPAARAAHRSAHWREFVREVEGIAESDPAFAPALRAKAEQDERIHFHVYDLPLLRALLGYLRERAPLSIRDGFAFPSSFETLLIIEKSARADRFPRWDRSLRNAAAVALLAAVWVLRRRARA